MFIDIAKMVRDEQLAQETPESIADKVIEERERGHRHRDLGRRADEVLRARGLKPEFTGPKELHGEFEADLVKRIAAGLASRDILLNELAAREAIAFAKLVCQAYQEELNARAEAGEEHPPATSGSKQCGEGSQAES